jgi:hypothetical protein
MFTVIRQTSTETEATKHRKRRKETKQDRKREK